MNYSENKIYATNLYFQADKVQFIYFEGLSFSYEHAFSCLLQLAKSLNLIPKF